MSKRTSTKTASSPPSPGLPIALWFGLAGALALFCFHIAYYWFLCDDAYISFRYARNLANGFGLVFNPGYERVEGYTNFLWVLILAAGQTLGIAPHVAANPLACACGISLFCLVVWYAVKHGPAGAHCFWALVPAVFLATNRSFAVWCTSGLETKLFELLVVGAVLRTIAEIRSMSGGANSMFPLSALLFAAAALTRPDGLLIAASVVVARIIFQVASRTLESRPLLVGAACFLIPVGGHFLFRRVYYEDWLPNTYYCKVGNRTWWDMGGEYLFSFALEYGLILWGPLLILGVMALVKHKRSETAMMMASAIVPHAIYLASIGGDHFEYRPIDAYIPLLCILMHWGAWHAASQMRNASPVAVFLGACLLLSTALPWLTSKSFVMDYRPGFPGTTPRDDQSTELIRETQHPNLFAIPIVGDYLRRYNSAIKQLTNHFVGLRQEEHMLFHACVQKEAAWIRAAIVDGKVPRDFFVAMHCVGVIPYVTDLRTLDRLGLTDREVARQPIAASAKRMMAHDKEADLSYARARGVDLWSADSVCPVLPEGHPLIYFLEQVTRRRELTSVIAPLGHGLFLAGLPLQGVESLRQRAPNLRFFNCDSLARVDSAPALGQFRVVPRGEQLSEPYDQIYVLQAVDLTYRKAYDEARLNLEWALATRPDNARARRLLEELNRHTSRNPAPGHGSH